MSIYTYTCRLHIDAIIKTSEDFKKIYLSLYLKGLRVRGSWRPNKDCNILTSPVPPDIAVCHSRSLGCLTGDLGAQPFWDMFSFQHLLTNWSGLQTRWGSRGPLLLGGGFLSHILSLTHLTPTNWLPVFTELYNSSIANSIFGMACLIVIKRK